MTTKTSRPVLQRFSLYITDNGRVVCGQHAGHSATYTGRDISGQRVLLVTKTAAAAWLAEVGEGICCEDCGRQHGETGDRERGRRRR